MMVGERGVGWGNMGGCMMVRFRQLGEEITKRRSNKKE